MIRPVIMAAFSVAVSLALAAPLHAQNPNSQKPKKNANQLPDTGHDEPAREDALERMVASVPVSIRADGTLVAELDDSFMEATTVTIGPDGVLKYEHFTGLENAEAAIRGRAGNGLLIARPRLLPYVPYPGNQDRE